MGGAGLDERHRASPQEIGGACAIRFASGVDLLHFPHTVLLTAGHASKKSEALKRCGALFHFEAKRRRFHLERIKGGVEFLHTV